MFGSLTLTPLPQLMEVVRLVLVMFAISGASVVDQFALPKHRRNIDTKAGLVHQTGEPAFQLGRWRRIVDAVSNPPFAIRHPNAGAICEHQSRY